MLNLAMVALVAACFGLFFAFVESCERVVTPQKETK